MPGKCHSPDPQVDSFPHPPQSGNQVNVKLEGREKPALDR